MCHYAVPLYYLHPINNCLNCEFKFLVCYVITTVPYLYYIITVFNLSLLHIITVLMSKTVFRMFWKHILAYTISYIGVLRQHL